MNVTQSLNANPLLQKLSKLSEYKNVDSLLREGGRLAGLALQSQDIWIFIFDKERQKFIKHSHFQLEKQTSNSPPVVLDEREIVRWLSRSNSEPVKFVKVENQQQFPEQRDDNEVTATFNTVEEEGTRILEVKQIDAYAVLTAIVFKEQVLGWVVVPKLAFRADESVMQTEHNLSYLGLQLGHHYSVLTGLAASENAENVKDVRLMPREFKSVSDVRKFVPPGLVFEVVGDFSKYHGAQWNIFNIKKRRVLIAQWEFSHKKPEQAELLTDLMNRQLEFYVQSVASQGELSSVDVMIRQIANDLSSLWEMSTKREKPDAINVHMLLIDIVDRTCAEGDFGAESMSFVGQADDKSESLLEIAKVLSSDRLVYRERVREIKGLSGWFMATSNQGRGLLPRFASSDLLERYQNMRQKDDRKNIAHLFGVEDTTDCYGFALFFEPDEMNQIAN